MSMTPKIIFAIFLLVGGSYTLIWLWIMLGAHRRVEWQQVTQKINRLRRRLFLLILAASIIIFAVSIASFPYQPVRSYFVGTPSEVVNVVASQYIWNISSTNLTAGVPIEFDVTSTDVNHGFAIFAPDGALYAQVQAMPGYINKLIVVFDQPGEYTVHCIEYCGVDHHGMMAQIVVS